MMPIEAAEFFAAMCDARAAELEAVEYISPDEVAAYLFAAEEMRNMSASVRQQFPQEPMMPEMPRRTDGFRLGR